MEGVIQRLLLRVLVKITVPNCRVLVKITVPNCVPNRTRKNYLFDSSFFRSIYFDSLKNQFKCYVGEIFVNKFFIPDS